jgi:DNA-binding CsgD family transcriptional regulator
VYGPAVFVLERLWGDDPALRSLLNGYGLTRRETDIALFTIRGLSNKEIARRLEGLSPISVRDALRRIFAKVAVKSRTEMVARILRIECPLLPVPSRGGA